MLKKNNSVTKHTRTIREIAICLFTREKHKSSGLQIHKNFVLFFTSKHRNTHTFKLYTSWSHIFHINYLVIYCGSSALEYAYRQQILGHTLYILEVQLFCLHVNTN